MLEVIIAWSIRNKFLVVLSTLFVVIAGVCRRE